MANAFYTSVERHMNDIIYRGYENGKPFTRKERFQPRLFIEKKNANSGYFSLGERKPLLEKRFDTMKECRQFLEEYADVAGVKIYGNSNYISQFIHEKFPGEIKFDINKIHTFMFDIEVDISDGYPNMETADKSITSIAIKSSKRDEYLLLGLKDYDKYKTETGIDPEKIRFIKFDDEIKLLSYFVKYWKNDYPEIVSGWNVEYFDIQYIITRLIRIFGEDVAKSLSPMNVLKQVEKEFFGKKQYTYHIYGMSILDYMDAFKKFGYKYGTQESYKLDHIAHVVLGERKLSYDEYGSLTKLYEENPQKYLDYNLKDTHLIQRFEEETALLALVITVAYDGGVNYKDAFGTVGIWESILYRRLMSNYEVPPVKGGPGMRANDLVGGYVKEPIPGMYKWVTSFDLNSLYPHLMMQYNMSPETLVKGGNVYTVIQKIRENADDPEHSEYAERVLEFIDSGLYNRIYSNMTTIFLDNSLTEEDIELFKLANKMHNYAICVNGALFTKDFEGMIPKIINEKYAERKDVKTKMLQKESELEKINSKMEKNPSEDLKQLQSKVKKEITQLHNKQMSVKILMNSLYGASANIYFLYYIMEMAEAITKSGQLSVQWSGKYVNEYMNKILKTDGVDYVVYIDTDSIYIRMDDLVRKVFKTDDISKEDGEDFLDKVCQDKIEKVIDKSYDDLYNILGAYKNAMKMKREKINDKALFVSKKRYVLNTLNSEGVHYDTPKISVTGLEQVRSSTPEVVRDKLKKSYHMVMNFDERTVQKFIGDFKDEFKTLEPEKIGKNSGTDDIEKYVLGDSYAKGCPGHVRGAIIYNNYLKKLGLQKKYNSIKSGDKIKIVYLKLPNPVRENVISFPEVLPHEFGLHEYIDYDTQFEKVFLAPTENILNVVGWRAVKVDSIKDMFE